MHHKLISIICRGLLMPLAVITGGQVYADCFPSSPTQTVSLSAVTIQADMSNGSVISTGQVSYTIRCNRDGITDGGDWTWLIYLSAANYSAGGPIGGYSNVVPTGIPGIGLRWTNWTSNVGDKILTATALNNTSQNRGIQASNGTGVTTSLRDTFELIKTGPIQTGTQAIQINDIALWRQTSKGGLKPSGDLYRIKFTPFTLTNASCTITQKNINVILGTVSKSRFTGPGSTSNNVPFAINLDCVEGTKINLQFDVPHSITGYPGTIALTAGSTAQNVGIQVVDQSNTPVTLNMPKLIGTTESGSYTIPFYARYIQISPVDLIPLRATYPVTSGTANGLLTFTLTYN